MKWYNGNLLSIMDEWKTDAVILVLGTNYLNAHEELLKIIKSYDDKIPIIWVGPFDKSTSTGRYTLIEKSLEEKSNCLLVKSDSIVTKLGIIPNHFYGTPAKNLADAIFTQFEPFLNNALTAEKKYWLENY